jgi:hypothetical protein
MERKSPRLQPQGRFVKLQKFRHPAEEAQPRPGTTDKRSLSHNRKSEYSLFFTLSLQRAQLFAYFCF